MRRLAVGRISRRRRFPQVRVQGRWLWLLGWEVGDKAEVVEDRGLIVLRKIHVEDSRFHQLRLPHVEPSATDQTPAESHHE